MLSEANISLAGRGLPYQERLDHSRGSCSATGAPYGSRSSDYIFAPEQARECLAIWDRIGRITLIGHSHLCKVFALGDGTVEELPPQGLRPPRRQERIRGERGFGGASLADFDNRASFTVYDTDKKHFRVQAESSTTSRLAADKILRTRLERNFAHPLFIGV